MKITQRHKSIVTIGFWSIISLYFGIGGSLKTENYSQVSNQYNFSDTTKAQDGKDGPIYANYAELQLHKEDFKSEKIFPFLTFMPDFVGTILTACCFGMLGGVISILKDIVLKHKDPENTKYISIPLLSFFTGIVMLGINYIIPVVLVGGENKIRPITLLFLSLFAGIYSSQFYKFLSSVVQNKIFHEK